jgi:hypothetical protein
MQDDELAHLFTGARRAAREQVAAVWQDQADRIHKAVDRQFETLEAELKPRLLEARREVVRSLGRHWNECFRRMRDSQSDVEWCAAVLDAVAGLARRSIFFSIRGESICFQSARGFQPEPVALPAEIPIQSAPAFLEVAHSRHSVEVVRSTRDLSTALAGIVGENVDARALLVPISVDDRVAGILYVEGALEPSTVESVSLVAGLILTARLQGAATGRPTNAMAKIANASPPVSKTPVAHAGAERAARVRAARLYLNYHRVIKAGANDAAFETAIRDERAAYKREFPDQAAYLDRELARTMGNFVQP